MVKRSVEENEDAGQEFPILAAAASACRSDCIQVANHELAVVSQREAVGTVSPAHRTAFAPFLLVVGSSEIRCARHFFGC